MVVLDMMNAEGARSAGKGHASSLELAMRNLTTIGLLLSISAATWAQSPGDFVTAALAKRKAVQSARSALQAVKYQSQALGVYPTTRLESGLASRPDVGGGEDLTLFQPFDLFGKTGASRASGRSSVQQAEASLRSQELTVQQEVLNAYSEWTSAMRGLRIAEQQLGVVQDIQRATEVRAKAQAIPEIQVERAGLEVTKYTQIVIDRKASAESALVKLNQAIGEPIKDSQPLVEVPAPLTVAAGWENERPELRSLLALRQGAMADARTARLSRLPDFEIQARRSPWSSGSEQYGLRVQMVFPLWDHGSARAREKAANAQAESIAQNYDDVLARIRAEATSAQVLSDAADKSVVAYTSLVDGAQKLLDRTKRGYELGAATLLDVLDAQRALFDAREQLSSAQLNRDNARTSLITARGQLLGVEK
jgi:outer membrane protein TolC